MMHGAPTYVGREKIAAFWAKDMLERNPLTILTVTDAVNGVDMVLVHGNYQVIQRDNGDVLGAGRFAHIWTRTADDKWLIDRDLWLEPDAR
jgi:ketosteroid isomerase-like protein